MSTFLRHFTFYGILIGLTLLVSCKPISKETDNLKSTLDPHSITGYWETTEGLVNRPDRTTAEIYDSHWYSISFADDRVSILFDDFIVCQSAEGTVVDNKVYVNQNDVKTIFVFEDSVHASVIFQHGEKTYHKRLEKIKDDPAVLCA